jgi:hypothetical protein
MMITGLSDLQRYPVPMGMHVINAYMEARPDTGQVTATVRNLSAVPVVLRKGLIFAQITSAVADD